MRLTDLNPRFYQMGGEGIYNADMTPATLRTGMGLYFKCPCGKEHCGIAVAFANPLDGGPPREEGPHWQRTGDTFETLTLTPSILKNPDKGGCGWHGYVTNGDVTTDGAPRDGE